MSENESRNERKKAKQEQAPKNKGSLNKVYYWIIGILFIILFLLVVYIFVSSGDKVNLDDAEETSSLVEDKEAATESDSDGQDAEETENIAETTDEDTENVTEESTDDSEEIVDEEISLSENAPLDTGYVVDYNTGSADRQAIKEKVMQATGLGNDLIENWIGNNGPGRVTADVHSPDKSEVYRVYLQYGEGAWHVTNYESLSSVPEN